MLKKYTAGYLRAALAKARNDALEEAAKIADDPHFGCDNGYHNYKSIAQKIRAMKTDGKS